jgi:MEDS: MEthanogen/methylotroph, DcmR Sensory domain
MRESKQPIKLAGSVLNGTRHACAFFNSRDEEYDVLMPYAREGFERGEKLFQIVDPEHRSERLRRLAEAGIGADGDQVEVRPWEDAYLVGGRFDKDSMLALVEEAIGNGKGFGLTRFWGNMEWALTKLPGVMDLVEYEARLNYIVPKYDDVVVCTYDLNKFSAAVVMDIMRTHPMVIIGGILQENPFFVPPDEFLRELKDRAVAE